MNHILFVVLIAFATVAHADLQDLLVLDCNGGLHAAEGFGLGATMRIPDLPKLYDWYHSRLYSRMQCACTGVDALTQEQFYQFYAYSSIDFYMNALFNSAKPARPCQQFYTQHSRIPKLIADAVANVSFTLPEGTTCTYADWAAGRTCGLSYDILPGITGQVAFRKCPSSHFPFISLTCSGPGCNRIGMFCNGNNECGSGQNCSAVADIAAQLGVISKPCFTKKREVEDIEENLDAVVDKVSLPARLFLGVMKGMTEGHLSMVSELKSVLAEVTEMPSQKRDVQQTCSTGTEVNASTLFQGMVNAHFYDSTDNPAVCVAPNVFFGNIINIVRKLYGVSTAYTVPSNGNLPINICTPPISSFNSSKFIYDICAVNFSQTPYIIDCSQGIKPWDGTMMNGQSATAGNRLTGNIYPAFPFPTSRLPPIPLFSTTPSGTPRIPLATLSCDGTINLMPSGAGGIGAQAMAYVLQAVGSPQSPTGIKYDAGWLGFMAMNVLNSISLQIPQLRGVANDFYKNIQTQTGCRKSLTGFTSEQTKLRFAFPPDFVFYYMTSPVSPVNVGPAFNDWTSVFTNIATKLLMPDSCTYGTWVDASNPLCAMFYEGLQALLGTSITIRLAASPCSSPAGSSDPGAYLGPQVNLDCVGKFCSLLTDTHYCSSNADCTEAFGPGVSCINYETGISSNFDHAYAFFNGTVNAAQGDQCFNSLSTFMDFNSLPTANFNTGVTSDRMRICSLDYRALFDTNSTTFKDWTTNQFVTQGSVASNQYLFKWPTTPTKTDLFPETNPIITGISGSSSASGIQVSVWGILGVVMCALVGSSLFF